MTNIQAWLATTGLKIAVCAAVLGATYWYGGHNTRAAWNAEKVAAQAIATANFRLDEINKGNADAKFNQTIQNQRTDANRLDAVLERVYSARPNDCQAADTSKPARTAAPQFEW